MDEQAPQTFQANPAEYLNQHPQAIADPAQAEIMAYASKAQEELVVDSRNAALDAASNIGNENFRSDTNRGAVGEANFQASAAEKARVAADQHATVAAEIYDKVKNL